MAREIRCDRCGAKVVSGGILGLQVEDQDGNNVLDGQKDLCDSCGNAMVDFFRPMPRRA